MTSALPVSSMADVLAVLPSFLRPDDPAPVRDAVLTLLLTLCFEIQDWAAYAAAQADLLRATGVYEDAIGAEREIYRPPTPPPGEDDEVYRASILTPPGVVSPSAVLAAVNAILAPYTSVQAKYYEQSDRWFVRQDGAVTGPQAYLYFDGTISRSPDYADRLYASEGAQNGGYACPAREPGAARVVADVIGRIVYLRVPDISPLDVQDAPVRSGTGLDLTSTDGFYVGTANTNAISLYQDATTSSAVYASIINVVNRIKGQSIRWVLQVDPLLVA